MAVCETETYSSIKPRTELNNFVRIPLILILKENLACRPRSYNKVGILVGEEDKLINLRNVHRMKGEKEEKMMRLSS